MMGMMRGVTTERNKVQQYQQLLNTPVEKMSESEVTLMLTLAMDKEIHEWLDSFPLLTIRVK